jgi:hypothetical protein
MVAAAASELGANGFDVDGKTDPQAESPNCMKISSVRVLTRKIPLPVVSNPGLQMVASRENCIFE